MSEGFPPRNDSLRDGIWSRLAEIFLSRRSLFLRPFFLLLTVGILMISVPILVLYWRTERAVRESIHLRSVESLAQVRSFFHSQHTDTISLLLSLSRDRRIEELMYNNQPTLLEMYFALERMDEAVAVSEGVHALIVVNPEANMQYSTLDGPARATDLMRAVGMSPAPVERDGWWPLYQYVPISYDGGDYLAVIAPGRTVAAPRTRGILVVLIAAVQLHELMSAGNPTLEDGLVVVNRSGVVLSHGDGGTVGAQFAPAEWVERVLGDENGETSFVAETADGRVLVSAVRELRSDWIFFNVLYEGYAFERLSTLRNFVLTLIVVAATCLVFVVLFTSARLYAPVRRAVAFAEEVRSQLEVIDEQATQAGEGVQTELLFDRTMERLYRVNRQLALHKRYRIEEVLRGVLEGRLHYDAFADVSEELSLVRGSPLMVVTAVRIDTMNAALRGRPTLSPALLRDELIAVIGEELDSQGYVIDMGGDSVAAILELVRWDGGTIRDYVTTRLASVRERFVRRRGLTVTIGVADPVVDFAALPISYTEAKIATDYRFAVGTGRTLFYSELEERSLAPYHFPQDEAEGAVESLKRGDDASALSRVDAILERTRSNSYENYAFSVQLLIHLFFRCFRDSELFLQSELSFFRRLREDLSWAETIDDVGDELERWFRRYVRRGRPDHARERSRLVERSLAVITGSFTDPNLSSDSVAATLSVSTNYVRQMVKSLTGLSIAEHINKHRLDYCKERLLDGEQTVKEIARAAGFVSYNSFFSTFRRYYGMTPGTFRRTRATRHT
ncbi:MAG: AraC family transcriptional regulator [Spirochaetales bacterium]|nr:AraC family transcriptional regulator [Spirochaetales bacterium]